MPIFESTCSKGGESTQWASSNDHFLGIENPAKKTEVSGYIDYAHRLKTEDFRPIFDGGVKLVPKPSDLSYYNWKTGVCASNDSPNFKVDAASVKAVCFSETSVIEK